MLEKDIKNKKHWDSTAKNMGNYMGNWRSVGFQLKEKHPEALWNTPFPPRGAPQF
jgi:hypothetical protein